MLTGLLTTYNTLAGVWRAQIAERRRSGAYKENPTRTGFRDLCDMLRREYLAEEEKAVRDGLMARRQRIGKARAVHKYRLSKLHFNR